MAKNKIQPTWAQLGTAFVLACMVGGMLFVGLNNLAEYLVKVTMHSWLSTPTAVVLVLAICGIAPLTVWMTYVIAHKMAEQNKEASDC